MRYFEKENASRPWEGVWFTPYAVVAGCIYGLIATDDAQAITVLSAAAGNPASGVREITQADYEAKLKKKAGQPPAPPLSPPPSGSIKGPAVAVAAAPKRSVSTEEPPAPKLDDLLKVQVVETPAIQGEPAIAGVTVAQVPVEPPPPVEEPKQRRRRTRTDKIETSDDQ